MKRMSRTAFQDIVNAFGITPRLRDYAIIVKERTWIDCFRCENSTITTPGSSFASCRLCAKVVVVNPWANRPYHEQLIERCPIGSYRRRR